MNKLGQIISLVAMVFLVVSCNKKTDFTAKQINKPTLLKLSAEFAGGDDDLRASLHHYGKNKAATTSFSDADFGNGTNKIKAYWLVKTNNNNSIVGSIAQTVKQEKDLTSNTLWLGEASNTIQGASLKMYISSEDLTKNQTIKSALMCLDGTLKNKSLEFKRGGNSDPNKLIKGCKRGGIEAGRHIPVMTKLEDYKKFRIDYTGSDRVKFRTRGALLGLIVKNGNDKAITITKILVKKEHCPLSFSGYFDLNELAKGEGKFKAEDIQEEWLHFPVTEGLIAANMTEANDAPCFYLWGFPLVNTPNEACQMKLVYTIGGKEETTKEFSYKPKTGEAFIDGKTYRRGLLIQQETSTIDDDTSGTPNFDKTTSPLAYVAQGEITTDGRIIPEYLNVQSSLSYINWMTWMEAMTFFGYNDAEDNTNYDNDPFTDNKTKDIAGTEYFLPSHKHWLSIIPTFQRNAIHLDYGTFNKVEHFVSVGDDLDLKDISKFTKRNDGVKDVTYALRFINTKYESAWRYYYDAGKQVIVIESVPLIDNRTRKYTTIEEIARPDLFTTSNHLIRRVFKFYGYKRGDGNPMGSTYKLCYYWSRTGVNTSDLDKLGLSDNLTTSYKFFAEKPNQDSHYNANLGLSGDYRVFKMPVRPFYKTPPQN